MDVSCPCGLRIKPDTHFVLGFGDEPAIERVGDGKMRSSQGVEGEDPTSVRSVSSRIRGAEIPEGLTFRSSESGGQVRSLLFCTLAQAVCWLNHPRAGPEACADRSLCQQKSALAEGPSWDCLDGAVPN